MARDNGEEKNVGFGSKTGKIDWGKTKAPIGQPTGRTATSQTLQSSTALGRAARGGTVRLPVVGTSVKQGHYQLMCILVIT